MTLSQFHSELVIDSGWPGTLHLVGADTEGCVLAIHESSGSGGGLCPSVGVTETQPVCVAPDTAKGILWRGLGQRP
jgi:hypothetical protein